MTNESFTPGAPPSPNDLFRAMRKLFLRFAAIGMGLTLFGFALMIGQVGHPLLGLVPMIGGMMALVGARMVKGGAVCPRCNKQLLWHAGPLGSGRVSLSTKKTCSGCGLDLEAPWHPPEDAAAPNTTRTPT